MKQLKDLLKEQAERQGYAPIDGKTRNVIFDRLEESGKDLVLIGSTDESPLPVRFTITDWTGSRKGYAMLDICLTWQARKQGVQADAAALLEIDSKPIILDMFFSTDYGKWQIAGASQQATPEINVTL